MIHKDRQPGLRIVDDTPCAFVHLDHFVAVNLAAVCFSVALSVTTVMVPLLSLTLFGYKAQPQYTGIFMGMISGSSMVGGMLSNYLFDSIGSYTPGLVAAGIVGFALIPLYLVLYRLTEKDKEYENTLAQKAA